MSEQSFQQKAKSEDPDIKLEFDPPIPFLGLPRAPSPAVKEEREALHDVGALEAPVRSPSAKSAEGSAASSQDASSTDGGLRRYHNNIAMEIEALLDHPRLGKTGTFASTRAYSDAPNPVLELKGLGTLGLPLSSRTAAALRAYESDIHPDDSDMEVASNRIVSTDTCLHREIEESKVVFHNAKWIVFLEKACLAVRLTLGILAKTKCRLSRLLFQDPGKCIQYRIARAFCTHSTQVVGRIAVVLPAQYAGGDAEVAHGNDTIQCSLESHGAFATSVIAWRTDTTIKLEPLTQGCRILTFDLTANVEPSKALLPVNHKLLSRLRRCLSTWADSRGRGDVPFKIISLLPNRHKYPRMNLRASALKGTAARLVSVVEELALPLGFRLGLASVTLRKSLAGYENRNRGSPGYGDVEEAEEVDYMRSVEIKNLVSLQGELLLQDISLESEEGGMVPRGWDYRFWDWDGEGESEEDYDHPGDDAEYALIHLASHRAALVIWPAWANHDMFEDFAHALGVVKAIQSSRPSAEELEALDAVLDHALPANAPSVLPAVARVALRWKDASLWLRAVQAYDGDTSVQALGLADIDAAYKTFGFGEVQAVIDRALSGEASTLAALDFLQKIRTWIPEGTTDNALENFVLLKRGEILNEIKEPLENDVPQLLEAAHDFGGDNFLETIVVPRLKSFNNSALLEACLAHIHSMAGRVHPDVCRRLIEDILMTFLSSLDIYSVDDKDPIEHCVRLCTRAGRSDLCAPLFASLATLPTTWDISWRQAFLEKVLLPFLLSVDNGLGISPCLSDLVPARRLVVSTLLEAVQTPPLSDLSKVSTLTNLVEAGAPWEPCLLNILSTLSSVDLDRVPLQELLRALLKGHHELITNDSTTELNTHVRALVDNYLATVIPESPVPIALDPSTAQQVVDSVELCFDLRLPEASSAHVSHILSSAALNREPQELREFLLVLVPSLRAALLTHQQSPTSELWAPVFRRIIMRWLLDVMGACPDDFDHVKSMLQDNLSTWTCNCSPCSSAKLFLGENTDTTTVLERIGRQRQHIEKLLQQHASLLARWSVWRVPPVPMCLTLTKTEPLAEVVRWETYRKEGLELLKTISADDEDRQKTLLGKDAEWVYELLVDDAPPREQVPILQAAPAPFAAIVEGDPPLPVKRPHSPSPLPSTLEALRSDGMANAERRPMKRERSQSVMVKTEMDMDVS